MPRSTPAPDLAQRLAAITLPSADGKPFLFGAAWQKRTAVVVHLRHFGCLYCRKQAAELKTHHAAIEKLGASVIAVGTGDLAYAAQFRKEFELPYAILSDDAVVSYEAVGAKDTNLLNWVKPGNLLSVAATMRGGFSQGKPGNHQRYLGATHVILPGGRVAYAWLNDDFAKDAPLRDVLTALDVL